MNLILASASPRRRELLTLAGLSYRVVPSECEENLPDGITPPEAVQLLAQQKADDVWDRYPDCTVLAADTVVALGDTILGKPKDADDAFRMLSSLSGRVHTVYTGVCIRQNDQSDLFCCATEVEL